MLRVVIAVALAVALLGASMPVIEDTRVEHADATVAAEIDELEATARLLRDRNDPTGPETPGARRTIDVHLPGPSWGKASLDYLVVPGQSRAEPTDGVVEWRVAGGSERRQWLSAPVVGPEGGLTLRGGGSRTLVLELTRRRGEVVVLVRGPGFKTDGATRGDHDVAEDDADRPDPR